MSTNNDNAAAAVIAFVSGAVIGSVAALLLTRSLAARCVRN